MTEQLATREERREAIRKIAVSLSKQGYDPVRQLEGYLLTQDPTYLPEGMNARADIASIDPGELLVDILSYYLEN